MPDFFGPSWDSFWPLSGSLIINIHITTIRCFTEAVLTSLLSDDSWVFFWLFRMQGCRSTLVSVCLPQLHLPRSPTFSVSLPHSW